MFVFNKAIAKLTLSKFNLRSLYQANEIDETLKVYAFLQELEFIFQENASMNLSDVKMYISILQYLHYQDANLDFCLGWVFDVTERYPEAKGDAYSLLSCLLNEHNSFIMLARIRKVCFLPYSDLNLGFKDAK
jgi:hypothetical protein